MKVVFPRRVILTLVIFVVGVYGYFVGDKHIFPYNVFAAIKGAFEEPSPSYVQIADHYYETDVAALIQIAGEADILAKRRQLAAYIWGSDGFPQTAMPTTVKEGILDERWADMANLGRIDRITTEMEWGLEDVIYHFIPEEGNNRLMLYQQGHRGDFIIGEKTIRFFLAQGYAVMGMAMPLKGMNNQPVVQLERFGRMKVQDHKHLKFLTPEKGRPIKYFLDPIARAVNYARQKYGYEQVHMIGISGGGWTTTLYAALDTRISASYPVAGSYPFYLRSEASGGTWGDYEQTVPSLYRMVNYPELYIMGAYGDSRSQLQIINQFDTCCFYGLHFQTYEQIVADRIRSLGQGEFAVYLDDSHKGHQISKPVLEFVLADLATH